MEEKEVIVRNKTVGRSGSYTRCAYCRRNRQYYPDLKFFSFPKEIEKCKKWVEVCGTKFIRKIPLKDMHKKLRLCSRHFGDKDYLSKNRQRLKSDACPVMLDTDLIKKIDIETMRTSLKEKFNPKSEGSSLNLSGNVTTSTKMECTSNVQMHLSCSPTKRNNSVLKITDIRSISTSLAQKALLKPSSNSSNIENNSLTLNRNIIIQNRNKSADLEHNSCAEDDHDLLNEMCAAETENLLCHQCGMLFGSKESFNLHIRLSHDKSSNNSGSSITCPEVSCKLSFPKYQHFFKHIADVHGTILQVQEQTFASYEGFMAWKSDIEKQMKCSYIAKQPTKIVPGVKTKITFFCHRSESVCNKKRNLYCPSCIEILIGEKVHTKFWSAHFGHEDENKQTQQSENVKTKTSGDIKIRGAQRPLDDVNKSNASGVDRINFLIDPSAHNISQKFKFLQNEKGDILDSVRVNLCSKSMKTIQNDKRRNDLFYKWMASQSVIIQRLTSNGTLKDEEIKLFEKSLDNIINIDENWN